MALRPWHCRRPSLLSVGERGCDPYRRPSGASTMRPPIRCTAIYSVLWLSHFSDLVAVDGSTWPNISPKTRGRWPNIALRGPNMAASWANLAPRCAYYRPCGWATTTTTTTTAAAATTVTADPTNTLQFTVFFGFPMRRAPFIIYNIFVILYHQVGPGRLSGVALK